MLCCCCWGKSEVRGKWWDLFTAFTAKLLTELEAWGKKTNISLTFELSNLPVTLQSCLRHLYRLSSVCYALVPGFQASIRPPQRKALHYQTDASPNHHWKFIIILINTSWLIIRNQITKNTGLLSLLIHLRYKNKWFSFVPWNTSGFSLDLFPLCKL